jgi:hypothetical protein
MQRLLWIICLLLTRLSAGFVMPCVAAESSTFLLRTNAEVDSEGIFLHQLVGSNSAAALPSVRLADAPPFRQPMFLTRGQINEAVKRISPTLVATNWSGAERVRVARRRLGADEISLGTVTFSAVGASGQQVMDMLAANGQKP